MADNTVVYTGTGRRKEAVARVRLVPGTGKIVVNGRDAAQYFGRQQLVDNAAAPLRLTETAESFDVLARCDGGGINGQSGALRLGIARALLRLASTARSSERLASSPVTPVPSSARSTASRRPASARSSRSARFFSSLCPLSGSALAAGPDFLCVAVLAPFRPLVPCRSLVVFENRTTRHLGKRGARLSETAKERGGQEGYGRDELKATSPRVRPQATGRIILTAQNRYPETRSEK